jgi:HEAT repeat protein
VSMRAGAALVRLGAGSVDVLDGMLREASTRLPALEILAAIGAPAAAALPAVVPLLEDPEPAVRSEAAFTLAALSDKAADAVPKLVPLLADGQPPEVRYTTAYALGRIGAAAAPAFERLVALSKSNDDLMATVAVWAALKIRPDDTDLFKEAVPLLQGALDSPRQLARLEAAVSLGELGEAATAVLPALELVADNDPVEAVRDAATAAIRRIRGR